jgi:hypothetical protein
MFMLRTCEENVTIFLHESIHAVAHLSRVMVDYKPVEQRRFEVFFLSRKDLYGTRLNFIF